MQGALKNKSSNTEITEESVVGKDAAIASIKKLITSTADKPYSLSIKMKGDLLSIFGYKNVTDIQANSFLVHRKGKEYKAELVHNFEVDICKKSGMPSTDTNLTTALTNPATQKRLSDEKFSGIVAVFSALADARAKLSQTEKFSSDTINLNLSKEDYREQFKFAVKLEDLIEAHQSKEAAIRSVLETTNTRCAVKACEEYYSPIECGIVQGWQKTEHLAKDNLTQLIDGLKTGVKPAELLDKSILEISAICGDRSMGIDLIEIRIKREIIEYNKSIEDGRKRVESPADVSSWEEGLAKEQVMTQEAGYKKNLDKDIKVHSLLEDALKILQKMRSPNEPNKP